MAVVAQGKPGYEQCNTMETDHQPIKYSNLQIGSFICTRGAGSLVMRLELVNKAPSGELDWKVTAWGLESAAQ